MENSIEKDIKILEEMIENANIENMDMNDCFGGEHIEAIEHILSDYKRVLEINEVLLKENEELKDFKKQVTDIESTNFIKYKNYIPIQTIEDKIEDLKMSGGSDGKDNTENTARELAIEALQDILDESKGK